MWKENNCELKIVVNNQIEISGQLDKLEQLIPKHYGYKLTYNWKNIPDTINKEIIKRRINKIFINYTTEHPHLRCYQIADRIQTHQKEHGNVPNSSDKDKFKNFIKFNIGYPNIADYECDIIANIIKSP